MGKDSTRTMTNHATYPIRVGKVILGISVVEEGRRAPGKQFIPPARMSIDLNRGILSLRFQHRKDEPYVLPAIGETIKIAGGQFPHPLPFVVEVIDRKPKGNWVEVTIVCTIKE
jgi:hypothetical protein